MRLTDPVLIEGVFALDDRGSVSFVNDFTFEGVKRFYLVENFSTEMIRAFHGHRREEKYVLAISGSALVAAVRMEQMPGRTEAVQRFVLSARRPAVLHIPPGFANGFRALEAGTKLLFFSTSTLAESQHDDVRFPYDHWGADVWRIENR